MSIGDRIKELRERRGWSKSKLAKMAKISQGNLSDIENGKIHSPSGVVLKKIADALGTTSDYLLGRTDSPYGRNVGSVIFHLRTGANMSVEELADRVGYPPQYIRQVEEGGDPSPAFLDAVSSVFRVPVAQFVARTPERDAGINRWLESLPEAIRLALSDEAKHDLARAGIELAFRADSEGFSPEDLKALLDAMIRAARKERDTD